MNNLEILLVGCGKMGSAMLSGWLDSGIVGRVDIIDPGIDEGGVNVSGGRAGVHCFACVSELEGVGKWDIVVLAVKPQIIEEACLPVKDTIDADVPVLSIAAGVTVGRISGLFHKGQPVFRAMPNTPAAIGKGITAICHNECISDEQKNVADRIVSTMGQVLWLGDEKLMNAVTAVSGSGPAYLFYFTEALAKAAEEVGFDEETAMRLARATVTGSAALMEHEYDVSVRTLRKNVTSPGGTTQAGLEILMNGEFQEILARTTRAAKRRGEELG